MKIPELEELYARYRSDLYRYCCFLTHDPVWAEDLLSETFLRVLRRLPTFRGEGSVKTWLFGIARNVWIEELRRRHPALSLDDPDAIPVCGFCWIHWTLCNLTETEVAEDISIHNPPFIQGCTSQHSVASPETREEASFYGGMAPPDAVHEYGLTVYALDCTLDLQPGFYLNELYRAMRGHILDQATVYALYRP